MNEDNWIKALATKERERRARFEAFQSAVPTFVEGLVKALKLDIAVYENEFPRERVGLESEPHRGSIHIVNHTYQPAPQAKIQCHSGRQELSCDFESTGHHHSSWIEKLEIPRLVSGSQRSRTVIRVAQFSWMQRLFSEGER